MPQAAKNHGRHQVHTGSNVSEAISTQGGYTGNRAATNSSLCASVARNFAGFPLTSGGWMTPDRNQALKRGPRA